MNNRPPSVESLPISALQHLLFCERQCALIHIEGLWAENRFTTEGRHLHERAHDGPMESRPGVRIVRGMSLQSHRLGIHGQADVVEFSRDDSDGRQRAYPIEYKRGRPKLHDADRVQLCAQALCLEEMLDFAPGDIAEGALFYGRTHRREIVPLNNTMRKTTKDAVARLHDLIAAANTPRVQREQECDKCSLINLCLPDGTASGRSAARWFDRAIIRASDSLDPPSDALDEALHGVGE